MAQRLVLSIVLQDIIKNKDGMPAAGYWMYFYDKRSPTTLRNAYYKNQEGNVVPAPNPLQLDENGALPHKLYYFVDVDDPEDRYTAQLKCRYGNAVAPELIFQDLPYFQEPAKSDPTNAVISDNLFIDGQFNIGLQIDDRGQGDGYVLPIFPQLPIAGLSWQFLRPYADSVPVQNRVDVDRIFIKEINEAEKISEGNPRFYLNVICEKFSETTPPLQKIVAFRSSNVLWGANTSVQLKFYAWKSGNNIPVTVSVIRNFGSKSSTVPQVIHVDNYTIDSDDPKVYFNRFALPKVTIPKDIGDDQYLLLQFSLPINQVFNFKITNLYCAEVSSPISVVDFKYPVRNADLAKSDLLFSSFSPTKYSISDSYKELIFTIGGLKFADNIGEIVTYPKGAKVNEEEMNLMKCDGRALDANGISPLGIEYRRLYEKLGLTPVTFDMLKTEDTPNWFNAISSEYIKRFVEDNKVKFEGRGVVNPKPEGDDIGHLWLETTFYANLAVDHNFQYVAVASSVDLTTCCHSFDISPHYAIDEFIMDNNPQKTRFANSEVDFPGYFRSKSISNLLHFKYKEGDVSFGKGIDVVTKRTEANYSIEGKLFHLTIYLDYRGSQYLSGFKSLFNPIRFYRRIYDIGFPLIIPSESSTFIQRSHDKGGTYFPARSQNYFLFSPWFVEAMSTVDGSRPDSHLSNEIKLLEFFDGKMRNLYIKTWGNYVIYKQSPTDKRTPGKPNVLFHDKNSVITYAIQHKALFTQRCLYLLKFQEVKAGDWIGLKTYNNTKAGDNFDTVVWWSVDDNGKAPTNVTAKEFREIKATKDTTPEELADMVANDINNKGATMFNIPNITDPKDEQEYYIKY